jgi:hypothetical protein
VDEGAPLLRAYRRKTLIEGSNPSLSATFTVDPSPVAPRIPTFALHHGGFALALAALGAAYLWVTAGDELGSLYGDGLIYLLTAREYAPYAPGDALTRGYAGIANFPPGYPLLLVLTGGVTSFAAAHAVTAIALVAAVVAVYAWLLGTGFGRPQAAVVALLCGILPGSFLQSFYLHPETTYMAWAFAGLALLARAEAAPRPAVLWAASAAITLALLTRSAGITLLPALAIALYRARPRGWPAMLVLPLVPWLAWSATHDSGEWSNSAALAGFARLAPASQLELARTSVAAMIEGAHDNVFHVWRLPWLAVALGAAALGVAAVRFVRLKADAWYLLAYGAMLAVWPFPQEMQRLTFVVMPILLAYVAWAGVAFARRATGPAAAVGAWAPTVVLGLVLLPVFALLLQRAAHPMTREEPALRHVPDWYGWPLEDALLPAQAQVMTPRALRALGTRIPPSECVYATHLVHVQFHTGHWNARRPPLPGYNDAAFERELETSGCRWFVLTLMPAQFFPAPYYPFERLGGRLEVVAEQRLTDATGRQHTLVGLAVLRDAVKPVTR